MSQINQTEIATMVRSGTVITSESGRVAGPRCREEYRLADGRILELTWDESAGTSAFGMPRIVEFVISARTAKNWRVSR
jgi:hypothetical protein